MEYYWWFTVALLFFIMEIMTPGFVLLWFGVGALVAGLLDLAGVSNIFVQIIVFVVVSIVLVFLSRTLFKNVFMRSSPGADLRTNADAMIGKAGIVTEIVDNIHSTGRVLIEGQDWGARSSDESVIKPGERIRILRIEGVHLVIERV